MSAFINKTRAIIQIQSKVLVEYLEEYAMNSGVFVSGRNSYLKYNISYENGTEPSGNLLALTPAIASDY